MSKSEFTLLILNLMNKIDAKDIYVAAQIFDNLDKERKGKVFPWVLYGNGLSS